jgi:hypothetical protein
MNFQKKDYLLNSIMILSIICFIIIVCFMFIKPFNDWSFIANADLFSKYGNFIGGLFGTIFIFISIILLYFNYLQQQIYSQNLEKNNNINRFEKRYFQMINTLNNLLQELSSESNNGLLFGKNVYKFYSDDLIKSYDGSRSYDSNNPLTKYFEERVQNMYENWGSKYEQIIKNIKYNFLFINKHDSILDDKEYYFDYLKFSIPFDLKCIIAILFIQKKDPLSIEIVKAYNLIEIKEIISKFKNNETFESEFLEGLK